MNLILSFRRAFLPFFCLLFAVSAISAASPVLSTEVESPEWTGTYRGSLPCVDCDGIAVALTLNGDHSFESSVQYLGIDEEPVVESGMFIWEGSGPVLRLVAPGDDNGTRFRLEDGALRLLGADGTDLPDSYRLVRE